jgi:hypothetical protein
VVRARSVVLAAIGALCGFLAETVHRRAGVWTLPGGGGMPLWVAAVYFGGLLGAALASRRFEAARGLRVGPRALAVEAALACGWFLLPPLLHRHEELLATLATAGVAARLLFLGRRGDLAVIAFVVVVDTAVEGTLVTLGWFRYAEAAYAPLPLWLAPLWAGLGLSLRRIIRALDG